MNLAKTCAIVTGGAMGIGFATTKRLLQAGAIVTIWDLNKAALKDAVKQLSVYGTVYAHPCDVTDEAQVKKLSAKAKKEMGKVDILINNAGYVKGGDFLEQPVDIWEKTVDVNFTSILYTTAALLPEMYERNFGFVVNISSAAGMIGVPNLAVYSATKWAVWGLTESLRMEAHNRGKFGVKFASIHPCFLAKGMFEGAQLGIPGRWIVPLVKDHDVIAKAIVESALKKERYSPKRPRSLKIVQFLRLLPDAFFQWILLVIGVAQSMKTWRGRQSESR
ncbi:MAG TPA: SDR family NAD(P)-dependent oxidoreductase [Bacteroidota bacterium]|nr:SDR family NAD(P)-dependent oxidoreductase [Bacteroidota bacterium]